LNIAAMMKRNGAWGQACPSGCHRRPTTGCGGKRT